MVKEEKESMAKVLERLQLGGNGSTSGREDWRVQEVVRTLEEQLVKERAKSQRSASKRCQEQRLLVQQVAHVLLLLPIQPVFFLNSVVLRLVGGAAGV